ncbi:MAG TPA: hypothetical protein VF062_22440 [Candidatus Limnocylindrales bacterium]
MAQLTIHHSDGSTSEINGITPAIVREFAARSRDRDSWMTFGDDDERTVLFVSYAHVVKWVVTSDPDEEPPWESPWSAV